MSDVDDGCPDQPEEIEGKSDDGCPEPLVEEPAQRVVQLEPIFY